MEEYNHQVLLIKPLKRISMEQSDLILRNKRSEQRSAHSHGTFDNTRVHLNFEIMKGGVVSDVNRSYSIPDRIKDLLTSQKVHDPNMGKLNPVYRTIANIIIGGSHESMYKLAFYKQQVNMNNGADNSNIQRVGGIEHWAKEMYNFFAKKYGENCIAAFIVHLDVNTPYINCILIPIIEKKNGKKCISWKKTFVGNEDTIKAFRQSMSRLMDELAEVNRKYGLLRGESFHVNYR